MYIEATSREAVGYFSAGILTGIILQVLRLFVFDAGGVIAQIDGLPITLVNFVFGIIFLVVSLLGLASELCDFVLKGWLFTLIVGIIAFAASDFTDAFIAVLALVLSLVLSARASVQSFL